MELGSLLLPLSEIPSAQDMLTAKSINMKIFNCSDNNPINNPGTAYVLGHTRCTSLLHNGWAAYWPINRNLYN
jgi:site-specific recombinase XerD